MSDLLLPILAIILLIVVVFYLSKKNEPLVIDDYDKENDNTLYFGEPKPQFMKLAPMNIMSVGYSNAPQYVPTNDSSDIRTNTTINVEGFLNSDNNGYSALNDKYVNGGSYSESVKYINDHDPIGINTLSGHIETKTNKNGTISIGGYNPNHIGETNYWGSSKYMKPDPNAPQTHLGASLYDSVPIYTPYVPVYYDSDHITETLPYIDFKVKSVGRTNRPIGAAAEPFKVSMDKLSSVGNSIVGKLMGQKEGYFVPFKNPDNRWMTYTKRAIQYIPTVNEIQPPYKSNFGSDV